MYATYRSTCTYTGPPIFHPDTEDQGVLNARRLYRATIAKKLDDLKKLAFIFTDDCDLVCINPPD